MCIRDSCSARTAGGARSSCPWKSWVSRRRRSTTFLAPDRPLHGALPLYCPACTERQGDRLGATSGHSADHTTRHQGSTPHGRVPGGHPSGGGGRCPLCCATFAHAVSYTHLTLPTILR